MNRNVISQ